MAKENNQNNNHGSLPIRVISGIKKRLNKRRLTILGAILLLIFGYRFWKSRQPKFEVDTTTVSKTRLIESISASGQVAADEAIKLNFETAGKVDEINVREGDVIKKGEILAKLETTNLYAAYQSADATLRAAQAALDSTYDTLQGKEKTETFAEISTRTAAETTKDAAYWAFVTAQRNLSGAILKAPFDGVITSVPDGLEVGANISLPSSYVFEVVNPDTIYFNADVNEIDIPKLTSNQKVIIELDAFPGEEIEGIVEGINFGSVTTSTGGTAYEIRISMPENDAMKYKLGMNGDAKIIISEQDEKLLVAQSAVSEEDGSSYVWIVDKKGRASKRSVETGASSINDIEIVSGISEGEKVITRPPSKLEEGDRVKSK